MGKYGSWTILREYPDKGRLRVDLVCDCGKESSTIKHLVVSGRSTMCKSCAGKRAKPQTASAIPTARRVYADYKHKATERNLSFDISFEDFLAITQQPCYYCDRPPSNLLKGHKADHLPYLYSGVDRMVNVDGYHLQNVVPSCKECNYAKRNMGINEFYQWACKIMMNVHKIAELAEAHDEEFEPFVMWTPEYFESGEGNA